MAQSSGRQVPPTWLGFHRNGLIIVLILDCLWMVIEVAAGASIIGIPAIPFIAFAFFGLSAYIVFSKQRTLGDSYIQATWKSLILGVIAGVPFPVFFTTLFAVFAIVNKILPKTSGVTVRMPSLDHQHLGKFTSEFKEIEELLKRAVQQVDHSQVSSKVADNIKFLKEKGMMPTDLAQSLDEIRKVRNKITHSTLKVPNLDHLRALKKCKEEIGSHFKF